MDILFVNLGIGIEELRQGFTVFGFYIAFYGVILGLGVLGGLCTACYNAKSQGKDSEVYIDFLIYALIFSIIGARAYYVIFNWGAFKDNLWSIFNIRGGGVAIYGAVIGAVATLIVFCKVRKLSFYELADTAMPGLLVGQIIGRWGNFVNCEAFGGYTNNLFAMRLKKSLVNSSMIAQDHLDHLIVENGVEYIQVHPTFLYESVWNLGVLILLWNYRKHKKFEGEIFWLYFVLYGLGRLWIEGMRTDQLMLFGTGLAVSQVLSLVMIVVGTGVIIWNRKKQKKTAEA